MNDRLVDCNEMNFVGSDFSFKKFSDSVIRSDLILNLQFYFVFVSYFINSTN